MPKEYADVTDSEISSFKLDSRLNQVPHACETVLATLPASTDNSVRNQVRTALTECLNNAIVHGNLDINADLRTQGRWDDWHALLEQRQADPQFAHRQVDVAFAQSGSTLWIAVQDQGRGYSPKASPEPSLDELIMAESGRGLMIVHHIAHRVEISAEGTRIEFWISLLEDGA